MADGISKGRIATALFAAPKARRVHVGGRWSRGGGEPRPGLIQGARQGPANKIMYDSIIVFRAAQYL